VGQITICNLTHEANSKKGHLPRHTNTPLKGTAMTETILRRPYVEKRCGLSRSTIYQLMAEGRFPRPVRLGKRAVGWRESDVTRWLDALSISDAA
jgi:prophage regulatory protein